MDRTDPGYDELLSYLPVLRRYVEFVPQLHQRGLPPKEAVRRSWAAHPDPTPGRKARPDRLC